MSVCQREKRVTVDDLRGYGVTLTCVRSRPIY